MYVRQLLINVRNKLNRTGQYSWYIIVVRVTRVMAGWAMVTENWKKSPRIFVRVFPPPIPVCYCG